MTITVWQVLLQRDFRFYLWNIAFVDLALVTCSLSVLLVPAVDFGDRMSLSLTLLLTAVAFKEVCSSCMLARPSGSLHISSA